MDYLAGRSNTKNSPAKVRLKPDYPTKQGVLAATQQVHPKVCQGSQLPQTFAGLRPLDKRYRTAPARAGGGRSILLGQNSHFINSPAIIIR